jgi:hypothetical protein
MSSEETDEDQVSSTDHNNGTCQCGLYGLLPPEIW